MTEPKWSTSFTTRKQVNRISSQEQQEITVCGSVSADGPKANRTVNISDNSFSLYGRSGYLTIPYESIDDLVDALHSVQSAIRNEYPGPTIMERIRSKLA